MLTDSCVMFFSPSRDVLSAILRDEYLTRRFFCSFWTVLSCGVVYSWFSHDVTKIQTEKLSFLLSFYFHLILEHLKTFIQTNFRFKRVLCFAIQDAWISRLLRGAAFGWRPYSRLSVLKGFHFYFYFVTWVKTENYFSTGCVLRFILVFQTYEVTLKWN